jgi:hypothetical protein
MLYQLSYASALKPTKNSRQSEESASSEPNFSSTPKASTVEKERLVPSPTTRIQLQTRTLANQDTGLLWKTPDFTSADFESHFG